MDKLRVQQQVPSWPQGATRRVWFRGHVPTCRWAAEVEALLQDSRQPIQPLGGPAPTRASAWLSTLPGTLQGCVEVRELRCVCWGGAPPWGRGYSARDSEPFGFSSAKKTRG